MASETCIFAIWPKKQNVDILLHLKLSSSKIQVCKMKIVSRPREGIEHCYRKKTATVGLNGRLSSSCNFFQFMTHKIMRYIPQIKSQTMRYPQLTQLYLKNMETHSNLKVSIYGFTKIKSLYIPDSWSRPEKEAFGIKTRQKPRISMQSKEKQR